MKRIYSILMVITAILFTAVAATAAEPEKKNDAQTVTIQAVIHCDNCVRKIERAIPFEKGVKDVDVDLPAKTVVVKYDTRKTSLARVLEAFGKIDVEVVSFSEE